MQQCRLGTLALFEDLDDATFRRQAHPDFSPAGWHLGHIAFTEAYWILERCAGLPPLFPEYHQLFAADGLPKCDRENLPALAEVCDYLHTVRSNVFSYLSAAPLDQQERLWRFLIQHESQHSETIAFVLQLQRWHLRERHWEQLKMKNEKLKIVEGRRTLLRFLILDLGSICWLRWLRFRLGSLRWGAIRLMRWIMSDRVIGFTWTPTGLTAIRLPVGSIDSSLKRGLPETRLVVSGWLGVASGESGGTAPLLVECLDLGSLSSLRRERV